MKIIELSNRNKGEVKDHLLRLSTHDRRLRFFMSASDSYINHYVEEQLDLDGDPNFGAYDNGILVGIASIVVINGTSCELAFSIDEDHRGSGLARKLMQTAIRRCEQLGVKKLCMSCLRENRKMQSLAKSFGLKMTIDFDEAYAELVTP